MDPKDLGRIPLFASLGKRERARIAQVADEIEVEPGTRLAAEGDLAYEFFVIEAGTARVDIAGEARGQLRKHDFFGEIGLLGGEHRRTATVTATTPMKLVIMTGHDFRAVARELPEVATKVRAAMEDRLAGVP